MNTLNLPYESSIPEGMTKSELAALVYPNVPFDTALPQGWVDLLSARGFDPRDCVIWAYPPGTVLGRPYPLTAEAALHLVAFTTQL